MTEKRYFKRMWEEEYYIFDSYTISEKEFDEKVEYEDYRAFADCLMGDEVVRKLNELAEENEKCKMMIATLLEENQSIKKHIEELYKYVKIDVDNEIEVYPKELLGGIVNILKIIGDLND